MHETITELDKSTIILNHHHALLGTFFSSLDIQSEYLEVKTNVTNEIEWDYIMPFGEISDICQGKNIYTNQNITAPNYRLKFKDSWLMRPISTEIKNDYSSLHFIEVTNLTEMLRFVDGFFQSYSNDDKSQPYGTVSPNYREVFLNTYQNRKSNLTYFYVVDVNNNIVGASAITIIKPYSYTYCAGIVPAFRGKKLSVTLLQHHENYSREKGCQYQIIQTEKNSFVEKIYLGDGFVPFETMNYFEYIKSVKIIL